MKKRKAYTAKHTSGLAEMAGDREKLVMIVEDDATHRRFMEEILKTNGFLTTAAENGLVALCLFL
jgi:PleD family two-component response regulator